ncbi:MAG: SseB family protein [Alphaproteobacteria bacterium]|nr:SseB family protein [Alphaproteobacteria bacterium]
MTAIDDAIQAAMEDGRRVQDFYELFFETEFFLPTHATDMKVGEQRTLDLSTDAVELMVIERPEGPVVPIFDTKDRLLAWAKGRLKVVHISVLGRQLVHNMDPALLYVLNPGTAKSKLFEREELDMLRGQGGVAGAA